MDPKGLLSIAFYSTSFHGKAWNLRDSNLRPTGSACSSVTSRKPWFKLRRPRPKDCPGRASRYSPAPCTLDERGCPASFRGPSGSTRVPLDLVVAGRSTLIHVDHVAGHSSYFQLLHPHPSPRHHNFTDNPIRSALGCWPPPNRRHGRSTAVSWTAVAGRLVLRSHLLQKGASSI